MKSFKQYLRESIRVVNTQPPLPVNGWRVSLLFDNERAREVSFINAARKLKWNPDAIIVKSGSVRITVTIKKARSAQQAVLIATKLLPELNLEEVAIEVKPFDEAKRVPLVVAAKDVITDLERFVRNQGPGPDKRLAALKSALKSGKISVLLSATKNVIDDLERFNRNQGPGPDKRLASLKAAITRGILGEETLNELNVSISGLGKVADKFGREWYPIEMKYQPADVKSGLVSNFEKAARKKGWAVASNTVPMNPRDRKGFAAKVFGITVGFGPAPGPFAQILISVNDAKNERNAIKQLERLATISKLKNPFIRIAKNLKKFLKAPFKV